MSGSIFPSVPELPTARSLVDVMRWRAQSHGERVACTMLADGESAESHLTYAELDARACAVAEALSAAGARGERALLLLPTGLDFVAAFFGCLYAGTVAVPFYPPHPRRSNTHLHAVIEDARPRFALITSDVKARLAKDERSASLRTIVVDEAGSAEATTTPDTDIASEDLAYLQYTSGSTRRPRGVTVRHGQLLRHVGLIWRALEQDADSVIVSWLPLFHDMGLVGTLATPLAFGTRTILMSPWHFLTKPARWLQCISRFRATSSGAPNFAYDLCVARTTEEDRQGLDLSRWTTAFSGAEPVRHATLERFAQTFAPYGFRSESFYPCYGLAEATLLVTGGTKAAPPVVGRFTKPDAENKRVALADESGGAADEMVLVGCGHSQSEQRVVIVDPDSLEPRADLEIGEIWVAGPTISTKYWNDVEHAGDTFSARTADGDGPFLRTGDLGFLWNGELFVTGRLKDLLIIRGHNYYAHDIERVVQESHPALAVARGAVFTVEGEQGEDLIVAQEVPRDVRGSDVEALLAAIRSALATEFGLNAAAVVPVRFGSIPKTSSGKTMRYMCKRQFLEGELQAVAVVEQGAKASSQAARPASEPEGDEGGERQYYRLLTRLRRSVAEKLKVEEASINPARPFVEYGLSSLQLAELAGDLEKSLRREIAPSLLYAHPTLDSLARYLTNPCEEPAHAPVQGDKPLAIIGLACRFPGAPDPEAFWELLSQGRDAISEVPPERWDAEDCYDPTLLRPGTTNTKWGGFIQDVDAFDAEFFGISEAEADSMDPQQRLLLEAACEALEDAGLPLTRVKGVRAGVFIGISTNDYARVVAPERSRTDLFWCTSSALSVAANRISYFLDVHGPSIAVDTACSSSLVALHLAAQSLRRGESELALVGGVNVMLSPDIIINMSQAGATSADGRCKAFDACADGLVRGEGVGVVVLKPLDKALADGDRVYAVVRGTAVNQDGATNGLTAPNPTAQSAVIRAAYTDAGVPPHSVQYVETHGPGTALGDPIELNALAEVVSDSRRSEVCHVGSVKTNIGHLEAAAGIAAIIKVALSLKHGQLPPSLHFRAPNPRIPFDKLKLSVVTRLEEFPRGEDGLSRAGVSSFGFGGTNAHAVLESFEHPSTEAFEEAAPTEPFHILPLSAPSKTALASLADSYRQLLKRLPDTCEQSASTLARLALSAGERRTAHRHRLAIVARTGEEAARRIEGFLQETPDRLVHWGEALEAGRPVFVFSGFETAAPALCRQLMKHEAFRAQVEACDELTRRLAGWSVAEVFASGATADAEAVDGLARRQLSLFAFQVGLAALWRAWGVEPGAVIGHSAGEVAAAYIAGALELSEALLVVHERSRLLAEHLAGSQGQGAMAAVRLSAAETQRLVERVGVGVEIAAHNAPALTVCAGERTALEGFLGTLNKSDVPLRMLDLPGPGHTSFVEPLREKLVRSLSGLKPRPARVALFSTVGGRQCEGTALDAEHWGRHLRAPVAFTEAVAAALADGYHLFLEIGTQAALSPCIAAALRVAGARGLAVPSLREQQTGAEALACAVAQLYVGGYPISWRTQYPKTTWMPLPKYPWQHKRHWVRAGSAAPIWPQDGERHPFLGTRLPLAPPSACWQRELSAVDCTWLRDHQVGRAALIPTTAYLKMGAEAAREILGTSNLILEDVELEQGVFIPTGETRIVQTSLTREETGAWRFEVHASAPGASSGAMNWTRAAWGRVRPAPPHEPEDGFGRLEAIRSGDLIALNTDALREAFRRHGIIYGDTFSGVESLWKTPEGGALARVQSSFAGSDGGLFEPGVLDACLQPMAATVSLLEADAEEEAPSLLPVRVERVRIDGELPRALWSYVRRRASTPSEPFVADALIFDDEGRALSEVSGFYVGATLPTRVHDAPPLRMSWPAHEVKTPRHATGAWLVISDDLGLGERLTEQLLGAGISARRVVAAHETLEEALAQQSEVAGIVDLRFIEAELANATGGEQAARRVAQMCAAALDVARFLASRRMGMRTPLWLVTKGGVSVADTEMPSTVQHPLWSMGRTIAAEEPRVWGGLVDLDPDATCEENVRALLATLVEGDEEDQVAWRGGRRHVARLAPLEPPLSHSEELLVRPDATYLVTGGMGDLGLLVARWLVRKGARRLILLGRTGLPPRRDWRGLEDGNALRGRVEAVRQLEAMGASVHLAEVDISAEAEVAAYLDAFRDEAWPEIRGVMHLAGLVRPAPLSEIDEATLFEHCAPKVAGAWNLHRYFADRALDFFVLFSSGSALLGSPGIAAYAAANGFLDALAAQRQAAGLAALSINWGFWQESGMAARVLQQAPHRAAPRGMRGLTNREALSLLGRLMSSPHSSLAAMPFDWHEWSKAHPASAARPYLRLLAPVLKEEADDSGISRAELLRAPADERRQLVEMYLLRRLAPLFEVEPEELEKDAPLTRLGIDSLMAVEMKNRVEAELEISIPIVLLLQGVSIAQLSTFVSERLTATAAVHLPVVAQPPVAPLDEEEAKRLLSQLDELPASTVNSLIESLTSAGKAESER
jgi:acyl transferase domain-containing protein/acyl-CoA synthetase (AMP-forming)/AMP-acid ligase II/acyl carrier protein